MVIARKNENQTRKKERNNLSKKTTRPDRAPTEHGTNRKKRGRVDVNNVRVFPKAMQTAKNDEDTLWVNNNLIFKIFFNIRHLT